MSLRVDGEHSMEGLRLEEILYHLLVSGVLIRNFEVVTRRASPVGLTLEMEYATVTIVRVGSENWELSVFRE